MKKSYTFFGRCYASVSSFSRFSLSSILKIETVLVSAELILSDYRVYTAKVSSQFASYANCTHSNNQMVVQFRIKQMFA
jgi:hypothetical protein